MLIFAWSEAVRSKFLQYSQPACSVPRVLEKGSPLAL